MKAACIVAFSSLWAFGPFGVSAETQPVVAATDAAEVCQSGSLIQQRLGSQKAMLPEETEAMLGQEDAKSNVTKKLSKKKRIQKKKQKSDEQHKELMAFLAQWKKEGTVRPEGSDCEQTGALLLPVFLLFTCPPSCVSCMSRVTVTPFFLCQNHPHDYHD